MNGFEAVLAALHKTDNIILVTHFNPDGDALGSLLGLTDILEGLGKRVLPFLEEPVSPLYRFLPGCAHVQTDWEKVAEFIELAHANILLVCLDCGDEHRLGLEGCARRGSGGGTRASDRAQPAGLEEFP